MKLHFLAAALLLVGGCATAPKPLQGEFSALLPEQASVAQPAGERVRWGGGIVTVSPTANQTCIEVLGRDLNESARPRSTPDLIAGRFLACRSGFYDPAIFAPEREVTVTGRIDGYETRRIGEYDYQYPRVAADVIYLWPERREVGVYHHSPFFPVYRPYGWGGFYSPMWFGVPHHRHHHRSGVAKPTKP